MKKIKVIGGGLAGCEASYQLLKRGFAVDLYEMRPTVMTPIHKTGDLAELVCSNSLKSMDENTSQGLLKYELELLDSLIIKVAKACKVPAGGALAVSREEFSKGIYDELAKYEKLNIIREECTSIDDYTIVATGPLTSDSLTDAIKTLTGEGELHFYDAVAPIVSRESIDMNNAFYAGRYGKGGDDYLNLPLDETQYYEFVDALVKADRVILKEFEKKEIFSACMPIEEMARKGKDSLRFGPLKPVGLYNPKDNKRPFAVVQLRKEDNYDKLYNLVGFQTNLKFSEQARVFKMIPALSNADFIRYGVMHRNTYINAPKVLDNTFAMKENNSIFFAGQISGVEGYVESAMSGLFAGINMARLCNGEKLLIPPITTACGSLMHYISSSKKDFQPMHVSYSLMTELDKRYRDKAKRREAYSNRAKKAIKEFVDRYIKE
ncbi:MAG: methylenetetrahydrofolate--tRNA-(uracil(54)-C(5))-methyltransferase (FADH(2)-oxidizing) TrmFO [Clostridiales bacterium]|nr:methylenetetrahydrofolate--tRNA-(uracil(54)-C(5))-methyltransferase (FADH(2)-oxidizing) TrmFO [Clostridiales bacterium]